MPLPVITGHLLRAGGTGLRVRCWDPSHLSSGPGSGLCWWSDMGHILLSFCTSVSPTVMGRWRHRPRGVVWGFCHSVGEDVSGWPPSQAPLSHPSRCPRPHPSTWELQSVAHFANGAVKTPRERDRPQSRGSSQRHTPAQSLPNPRHEACIPRCPCSSRGLPGPG